MSDELREQEDAIEQEAQEIVDEAEESVSDVSDELAESEDIEDEDEDDSDEDLEDDEDDEDYEYEDEDEEEEEIPPEEVKFTTTSDITLEEYKRMTRSIPWSVLMPPFLKAMIFVAALSFALSFVSSMLIIPLVFIPGMLLVCVALWALKGFLADRAYGKMMLKSDMDTVRTYDFCETYLLSKGAVSTTKIHYSMIKKMIETELNIYLQIRGVRMVVILVKENCSEDLIAFLKERFPM